MNENHLAEEFLSKVGEALGGGSPLPGASPL